MYLPNPTLKCCIFFHLTLRLCQTLMNIVKLALICLRSYLPHGLTMYTAELFHVLGYLKKIK
jgi:hypothetical protein